MVAKRRLGRAGLSLVHEPPAWPTTSALTYGDWRFVVDHDYIDLDEPEYTQDIQIDNARFYRGYQEIAPAEVPRGLLSEALEVMHRLRG